MLKHFAQRNGLKDAKENPQRLHSLDQFLAEEIGSDTRFPSLRMGSGGIHDPEQSQVALHGKP